jgi:lysophospholipase L1-like esterase
VLVAAAIVALYDVVVPRLMPDGGHSADVQQENVIHAQSYLYPRAAIDTVVVGSSKLARLDFSEKSGIFNLAISGQGARTGLELVLRSPARPRRVVIEVGDTLLREPDATFLSGLFNPVNDRLRRWIPVLRDTYQPGAILDELAKRLGPKSKPVDAPMTPDLYQKVLQTAIDKHTVAPAPEVLARIMTSLQRQLAALRARGAAVYFFEPPEEPPIWNSPQSTRIRQEVERLFPDVPRFPAFPLSGPASYRTTDGIHLDVASANRFGAAIEAWLATQP